MGRRGEGGPEYPGPPTIVPERCPVATSLKFLGRKWNLTILRDVAFYPKASFALIRKGNAPIRARVLSARLRELAFEGLIRKVIPPDNPRHPYYELTAKGRDIWPILSALYQFGTRHHADVVFADRQPRSLGDVYPEDAGILVGPIVQYARSAEGFDSDPGWIRARSGSARHRINAG